MKALVALIATALLTVADASMLGIKIGSPESALTKLTIKQIARSGETTKYRTDNGNDFVVTTEEGKVVFMENDWNQKAEGGSTLIPGFTFGQTSLKEIRKRFETKGFVYAHNQNLVTKEYLYEFHCFEVENPVPQILVVVTKIPFATNVTENTDIATKLKLDAIVLADPDYLESLWGEQKSYSEGNKRVRL
ncbi:hypothetical protein AM493_05840 [Flavobacterium akiainvivens]|uniref:Uncharacterized protein n=1 Tax=Flavobacterium akiainvivens TaxID=1202724 RepID=A0A0M8MHB9_9FLAO|nr:hypothetical protein [Flavobacterium akiainvivens]KOS05608.1 hypothetical protein AM493_05840 [Flavobacterium akiainvivens]SFQ35287.1 hypothetical protein SAMN05444144_103204 [Flavobacterium akiainvivens]